MQIATRSRRVVQGLVLAVALGAGTAAMAEPEPTLNQVYATAQSGKLDQAQLMIQQVLIGHPNSAKAYFVRAELYARQGDAAHARESLATAERLSPGLSFAKPEAVQALRSQLAGRGTASTGNGTSNAHPVAVNAAPVQQSNASASWALPVLLLGIVLVAGYFIFRRRAPQPDVLPPQYGPSGNGLSGPQTFGMGGGGGAAAPYPAGGYAQPAGTGLGGRIMGGVATGLAVGAGVMAAEAIGRSVFGNHNTAHAGTLDQGSLNDYQPIADTNRDMGGNDFGINDAGSWDDGGGGDWDN
ncbi:MAG: tetratricopeptide repeat protein [Burkholderiales bacterium]|nr:tetratricopeptide repeat protein [Burkholderiales bacterium]